MGDTEVQLRRPRLTTMEVASNLSPEEVQECREAFEVFDKNCSGRISLPEVGEMLTNLGKSTPTEGDLEDIMEELDTDQNGGVDFSEFLQFMTRHQGSGKVSKTEELSGVFDVMDSSGKGFISAEDLAKVMQSLGLAHSRKSIDEMIGEAGNDGGSVTREQFIKMMA